MLNVGRKVYKQKLHGRCEESTEKLKKKEVNEDWLKENHLNKDGSAGGQYDRDGITGHECEGCLTKKLRMQRCLWSARAL